MFLPFALPFALETCSLSFDPEPYEVSLCSPVVAGVRTIGSVPSSEDGQTFVTSEFGDMSCKILSELELNPSGMKAKVAPHVFSHIQRYLQRLRQELRSFSEVRLDHSSTKAKAAPHLSSNVKRKHLITSTKFLTLSEIKLRLVVQRRRQQRRR